MSNETLLFRNGIIKSTLKLQTHNPVHLLILKILVQTKANKYLKVSK